MSLSPEQDLRHLVIFRLRSMTQVISQGNIPILLLIWEVGLFVLGGAWGFMFVWIVGLGFFISCLGVCTYTMD